MRAFAELLDGLIFCPARTGKLRLMADYFRTAPDPDRGWALAALAGAVSFRHAKPALLRQLAADRVDPYLFALSYDYVGDLAETVALIWPGPETPDQTAPPALATVVDRLDRTAKAELPGLIAGWLDGLDQRQRWALLKLITGGLRVGVSARLAKTALAQAFALDLGQVEEVWHALAPPYEPLFAWAEGRRPRPDAAGQPVLRPFMLAHPLDDETLDPADYLVEWKWDGIRVQLVAMAGQVRLYSRTGDDISAAFPDVVADVPGDWGVLDGELLTAHPGQGTVAPFNHLQQRLNRKRVTKTLLRDHPAFVRAYDLLFEGQTDRRAEPIEARRAALARSLAALPAGRFDLSETLAAPEGDGDAWAALARLAAGARAAGYEGLMLKRRGSPYVAGRRKGLWFKWKRDPLSADLVVMYAQRGHGKRSSYYSDFTFGAWAADGRLLPVAKAYFGFTDADLRQLDRFVRDHTVERFGPVREVAKTLVVEVAFDSLHPSSRHKSGLAMRFPRVKRIRWDKPAAEADSLDTLAALIER
ncbi:ATP-dependent DNA ligase [Rhodothalassium salexigens]|uniref:cisplatin damage response ATP-dependent DNA ligase n=1 Tax=Rhodothalassium salexigens TaxID=1086 RepID=UPI001913F558|nr:cisplatin damage response ATP-dependent DNA ligase [Rhodothalassium salexigens]MBK5921498.1 ATP-dependent DNA ligase [Rhodothalassium salexigens]